MKMLNKAVELKGYRNGLHLIINSKLPFEQVESAIVKRLTNIGDSLSGERINLDVGDRVLKDEDLRRLQKLLEERYRLEISQVNSDSQQTVEVAEKLDVGTAPAIHRSEEILMEENQLDYAKPEMTRLIRHTLRSGQRERFLEGNIVIIGDVNPGGEVIASGDVIVLGALRGMAHAGALGDNSAVIIALDLRPTQLRLGRIINRPDDDVEPIETIPEIARVEDNVIKISPYKKI